MTEKEMLRPCGKCLLLQSGKEDILADIKSRIDKLSPDEKTDEKAYGERLAVCSVCEYLLSGTCLKCGCYPEFRAAFAKNDCPVRKWQK